MKKIVTIGLILLLSSAVSYAGEPKYFNGLMTIYTSDIFIISNPYTYILIENTDGMIVLKQSKIESATMLPILDGIQKSNTDMRGRQMLLQQEATVDSRVNIYAELMENECFMIKDSLYTNVHYAHLSGETIYYIKFAGKLLETANSTVMTWEEISLATGFRINIYDTNGQLFAIVNIDDSGRYIDCTTKSGFLKTSEPFSFDASTLGLKENETFYYTITALSEDGETKIKEGVFKTGEKTEPVRVETISVPAVPVAYYNLLGQKLNEEPQRGMYIVQYSNGSAEKRVR
ncbi:MAG: hypothetical protein LBU90_00920 [Bacteroidales bacterium]|nr:hypothetical protein [Bacteroidales bacterium]